MASVSTGSGGSLILTASETGHNSAARTWSIHVVAQVGTPSGTFGNPMGSWSVKQNSTTLGSGSWSTDSAANTETLYDATVTVSSGSDGTGSVTFTFDIGATDTIGVGGPASVSVTLSTSAGSLTTLIVAPGAPTGVTATRVSDVLAGLAWTNNWASNGAATSEKVLCSVNGATAATVATIAPATSVNVACAANQKLVYTIQAINSVGSATSAVSNTLYTTPAAPTGVTASKDVSGNVVVAYTDNVAFAEHTHVVEAASSTDGGASFGAYSTLTSSSTGGTYTHAAPDPAKVWKYRVSAKNSDTAGLTSAGVESNSVQLLTAPSKPTIPTLNAYQDKAVTFRFPWTHNAVDSTAQTKFQVRYSTNGGSTWTTGAKTTSTNAYYDFAGGTYTAGTALTVEVRTKGQYDSGSDGDASYSPWSDPVTVTFKTQPTLSITSPATPYTQAALHVGLTFAQAEGATFVTASLSLYAGPTATGTPLEVLPTTTLADTLMVSRVVNGGTYTLAASGIDSNGLATATATVTFDVDYTSPATAIVSVHYLDWSGFAQVSVTIPPPGVDEVAAVSVTVRRQIDGVEEVVFDDYPASSNLSLIDRFPTINGTNTYVVETVSADGAAVSADPVDLVTAEEASAFLTPEDGTSAGIRFWALPITETPSIAADLFAAEGRAKLIGLYGVQTGLTVGVAGDVMPDWSTAEEIRTLGKTPGRKCYRDPFGNRIFGTVPAIAVTRTNTVDQSLSFTITESD